MTAPDLAPVVRQVRTALSAPVKLHYRKTTLTVTPLKMSEFLVLPSEGTTKLRDRRRRGGDVLRRTSPRGSTAIRADAEFELDGNGQIHVVPSGSGRELSVETSQNRLLKASLAPTARTGRLAVTTTTPEITTEKAKSMGITGVVSSYTTTYGGDPNRLSNVQLVSAAPRRPPDRAGRGVLLQRHDRRAQRGEGLPGGARHHQWRAADRARRRRLPGLDDGLQRRLRGRALDRGAHEPRALHQPLPDRSRRDRQLPRHRPQVHERHRALALAADVRRLRVADGQPLRNAGRPAGRVRDVAAQDVGRRSPSTRSRTKRSSSARSGSRTQASRREPYPFAGSSTTRTAR